VLGWDAVDVIVVCDCCEEVEVWYVFISGLRASESVYLCVELAMNSGRVSGRHCLVYRSKDEVLGEG